ncbi:MAG TPA: type III polyketide synthase [Gemmataceae bacterium]|nr:type III polyketide synthase [Gemmataceae bacterium]
MSLAIRGIGTALPPNAISQVEAAEVARVVSGLDPEEAAVLPPLYRQTGIATRHMVFHANVVRDVLEGTNTSGSVFLPSGRRDDRGPTTAQRMQSYAAEAPPLALQAASQALAESGLSPTELTHLVTVSCTGFGAPGIDVRLIKGLGLAATVQRTHIGFMGCHGAINGLRVAAAFTGADPGARVLLCAIELCSLHYHYGWDPKRAVGNALFADGAAAVVGVPAGEAPADTWRMTAAGSCLFPNTEYAMGWTIGDHGFEMTLSTRVPGLIRSHLRSWLEDWLASRGMRLGEIASWAVHPGGPRVLGAVAEPLGLPPEAMAASREVLAECGNMSSPTVLFILDRLRRRRAPRPCVALAFGPGLAAEAVLIE